MVDAFVFFGASPLRFAVSVVGKLGYNPRKVTLAAIQNFKKCARGPPVGIFGCTVCALCKGRRPGEQKSLTFSPRNAL